MDTTELAKITTRWAAQQGGRFPDDPTAKFITGDYHLDLKLHYFEQDTGIALKLGKEGSMHRITGYNIVNEEKYTMFVLKWL